MPKYVSFFSSTADAWSRMIERPENRASAAYAPPGSVREWRSDDEETG